MRHYLNFHTIRVPSTLMVTRPSVNVSRPAGRRRRQTSSCTPRRSAVASRDADGDAVAGDDARGAGVARGRA